VRGGAKQVGSAKGTASRRDVLVGAGGGLAALQLGLPGGAQAAGIAVSPPLFVFDRSIEGTADAAYAAAEAGARVVSFRHDVGALWFDVIAPAVRHTPVAIAGISYGGAFFALDHMARDHRLICTARAAVAPGRDIGPAATALLRLSSSPRSATDSQRAEYGDAPVLWLLQPIQS